MSRSLTENTVAALGAIAASNGNSGESADPLGTVQ